MLSVCCQLYATGPSSLRSEIRPISINEKREILCRTRFTKNEMGAHTYIPVTYGFCIITTDTIMQYTTHEIVPSPDSDFDEIMAMYRYWDNVFESHMDSDDFDVVAEQSGCVFNDCNIGPFKLDAVISLDEFTQRVGLELRKVKQKALYGATGSYSEDEDIANQKVEVLCDFGYVILIKNVCDYDQIGTPEYRGDINFDYPNTILGDGVGYDIITVTGVLFTGQ